MKVAMNSNNVKDAALALVALRITQPELEDEEYADRVNQSLEEYCPLFRVPENARTPAEEKAAEDMHMEILAEARRMEKKLRSSKDPLLRALAGMQRMTVE